MKAPGSGVATGGGGVTMVPLGGITPGGRIGGNPTGGAPDAMGPSGEGAGGPDKVLGSRKPPNSSLGMRLASSGGINLGVSSFSAGGSAIETGKAAIGERRLPQRTRA